MKMSLRKMKESDIIAVSSLEMGCLENPWPEKQIVYELKEDPVAHLYVAVVDNEVVGYIDFMITFDSASVSRLAVNSEFRNKGIGTALLDKMVEVCLKQKDRVSWITLEVRASNLEAIKLYKKNGWEQVTIKKKYYDNEEDALYLVRSI